MVVRSGTREPDILTSLRDLFQLIGRVPGTYVPSPSLRAGSGLNYVAPSGFAQGQALRGWGGGSWCGDSRPRLSRRPRFIGPQRSGTGPGNQVARDRSHPPQAPTRCERSSSSEGARDCCPPRKRWVSSPKGEQAPKRAKETERPDKPGPPGRVKDPSPHGSLLIR
jgi:hypothetical protein